MKITRIYVLIILGVVALWACAKTNKEENLAKDHLTCQKTLIVPQEPHRYGGWYCPDNLFGFPAVDIANWENVPVVNGRMPTKEETQNGTSLIFVDQDKYPNSGIIDMKLPRLAKFENRYTNRIDDIIIIQAVQINEDSIVGFRFVNGGNGSARLKEVNLMSEKEVNAMPKSKFVTKSISLNTSPDMLWNIMTKPENLVVFEDILESNGLMTEWRRKTNVNFHYPKAGNVTASFGDKLFGNYYVQNDYENSNYTEKFFITENEDTKTIEFKVVLGPFESDFDVQNSIIDKWLKKVKFLCENSPNTK